MRNIFTLAVAILANVVMMAQTPAIELTAKSSEIGDWNTTYDNVTISVEGAALTGKKPCGVTEKENVMSISSSDSQWIEISSTDGLSKIIISGSGNNTGNTDWAAPLCACASAPFDNTIIGILEVHYTGYEHECIENEILLPEGTKSVRIYRRMKVNSEGTEVGSGSNWTPSTGTGNQTFNITYLAVYAGATTPSTDPVSSVTLAGPEAVYVGQTASYTASPDQKATAYKWTVDGIEQGGATSNKFDYAPAAGTYAIIAYAKNDYNSDWVASNTINLVVSEKTELEQVPVTAATVWDWTKAGTGSIEWKDDTTPRKDNDTVLLANVEGINNNAEFNSQALRFAGQYPIRDGKYCQGPWISFKTTVAGYVQVEFSNTGSKDVARYVAINGVVNTTVGTLNTTKVESANIPVEAGDVVIEGSFDPYESQYLRIYKITFSTDAPPAELSHDATLKSLVYGSEQTSVPDFSPTKYSYEVVLPSDYVGGAPSIQAEKTDEKATLDITQASSLPGTAEAVVTAEDGTTKNIYTVAFSKEGTEPPATTAVTGVTLDKSTLTLKVGQTYSLIAQIIPSNATNQNVTWSSSNTTAAIVSGGVVTANAEGTAKITVKTDDGGFEDYCNVTVEKDETPTPPVPSTDLTLHEPGIYEASIGGYNTTMVPYSGRLYEIYYIGKTKEDGSTVGGVGTQLGSDGKITNIISAAGKARDGWFEGAWSSTDESTSSTKNKQFPGYGGSWKMNNGNTLKLHVVGFDQFSILAKDKKSSLSDGRYFQIKIDTVDVTNASELSTSVSVRDYDITPGEHVIEIIGVGSETSQLYAFSLREAEVPMVKYIKGNDSMQVVLQTNAIKPVVYTVKYNNIPGAETKLESDANDFTLEKKEGSVTDTLTLSGTALCPVGTYDYAVVTYYNNVETSRVKGKFSVASDISAVGDTAVEVYEGEAMGELKFRYYALNADDVKVAWKDGNEPAGINKHGENGIYIISGTPTQQGEYPFTISVKDGNSLNGLITVLPPIVGDNLVLYLFTNGDKKTILEKDGVADYIAKEMGYTFVPQQALSGLRSAEQYQKYKWVLISENANANNEEVLALTQQSAILPVLNMKAFTYAEERLSWGDPNNGSLTENGRNITVQRDDHPIFQALGKSKGSKIQVLTKIDEKGLMPIDINLPGTHCLATSLPRSKTNYYGDGKDPYTFLHEVPAGMRGGKKYICLPIAMSSSKYLDDEGLALVKAVVNYLLNDEPSIQVPQLQITSFVIDGINGKIDQSTNKITFEIDLKEHFNVDKYAVKPTISWADSTNTHVTPTSGEAVDFSESWGYPVAYEVSDYINRRVYEVAIRFFNSEGIEDVYAVGDWVNIYDIFGRKVSTTNEDIYHMVLPRGVYIIVTETGQTFKIMR